MLQQQIAQAAWEFGVLVGAFYEAAIRDKVSASIDRLTAARRPKL